MSNCLNSRCGLFNLPKGITTELVKEGEFSYSWKQVFCTCEAGQKLKEGSKTNEQK